MPMSTEEQHFSPPPPTFQHAGRRVVKTLRLQVPANPPAHSAEINTDELHNSYRDSSATDFTLYSPTSPRERPVSGDEKDVRAKSFRDSSATDYTLYSPTTPRERPVSGHEDLKTHQEELPFPSSPSPTPAPLTLPAPLPLPSPSHSRPPSPTPSAPDTVTAPSKDANVSISSVDEKISPLDEKERPSYKRFTRSKFTNNMRPEIVAIDADAPAVVLPYAPTDGEKYIYAKTRRLPLYIFGTFSFLSISAAIWLFSLSTPGFYWFAPAGFIVEFHMVVAYVIGYFGRDYELEPHKEIVEEYATSKGDEPSVDVLLPCCGEPLEILENTYRHIAKLDYSNYKVHVLDDGALDTVKQLAERYGFNYIRRDNRPYLKKAGNLRYSFTRTEGEFFAIFDADFCPRHDFLRELVPLMRHDPKIAIVQTPQFFRPCAEQTWVEQGASSTQELFYRVIQVNRNRWGAPICVGSNALYRRAALEEVGGTAEIGHSEDVHTGFFAMTRGWRVYYVPLALACGISPDIPKAYFSQQMRWCSGSSTLLTNPEFWRSPLTIVQKLCFLTGMLYYAAASMTIFLNAIPVILMLLFNPSHIIYYNFFFVIPSLLDSVIIFRLWSRQRYNFNVNHVFVIQQYAYLMAIKDRILGTTAAWVPSGNSQAQGTAKAKGGNNKYRNSRIFCAIWVYSTFLTTIGLSTWRIVQGYHWYHYLPTIILDCYTFFITFHFIWYS